MRNKLYFGSQIGCTELHQEIKHCSIHYSLRKLDGKTSQFRKGAKRYISGGSNTFVLLEESRQYVLLWDCIFRVRLPRNEELARNAR
jgi:hypothetical protein